MEQHNDQERKGGRTRKALGDITREVKNNCNNISESESIAPRKKGMKRSTGTYEDASENQNPKPAKAKKMKKTLKHQDQSEDVLEVMSSGDENEEITDEMRLKPTLYSLASFDLASVQHKDHLMRGPCVQAVAELLHSEKRREDLTCVSTDFYSLLMEGKFTEAKKLKIRVL